MSGMLLWLLPSDVIVVKPDGLSVLGVLLWLLLSSDMVVGKLDGWSVPAVL